jgi:hypothetical protein
MRTNKADRLKTALNTEIVTLARVAAGGHAAMASRVVRLERVVWWLTAAASLSGAAHILRTLLG